MENAQSFTQRSGPDESRSQVSELDIKSSRRALRLAERDMLTPGKGKFARLLAAREHCAKASRYEESQVFERRIRQMSLACDLSENAVRSCERLIDRIIARLAGAHASN